MKWILRLVKRHYQRSVNLLSALRYPLVFCLLLLYLPLTAFSFVPGYGLLGGLYSGLAGWHVFFAVLSLFGAAWSLMFATGLLVDGIERRGGRPIASGAQEFFGVPVSRGQFWLFTLVAAVGALIVVIFAERPTALDQPDPAGAGWPVSSVLFAVAGALVCYLLMILLCTPARLASECPEPLPDTKMCFEPLPDSKTAMWLWSKLDGTVFKNLSRLLLNGISRLLYLLWLPRFLLEKDPGGGVSKPPRLRVERYFALTNFLGIVLIIVIVGKAFWPPDAPSNFPPAAAYLHVLLMLSIWVLLSLTRHLAKIRISPLIPPLLLMIIFWRALGTDHHYRVPRSESGSAPLTPVEMIRKESPSNIVVVSSAGGGILAASWTTLVLKELISERRELSDEIRLLSGISGGAVGAAHFVAARLAESDPEKAPRRAYVRSTKSSLAETVYGLAMLDFWRLFTGGWTRTIRNWDRVRLQEDAWCRIAGDDGPCTARYPLSSLREPIRQGRIPAIIFGATVMETGRRVMITPLDFESGPATERSPGRSAKRTRTSTIAARAPTLSEYLFGDGGDEADIDLWTGARLSATFAYVSPAASARIVDSETDAREKAVGQQAHHLLDGGYYENFGVTSALDWMEEVLEAKKDGRVSFDRLLLIRLNAFGWQDPLKADAQKGSISSLLGPALGLASIRSGVATTRNEFELTRYIEAWNERLGSDVVAQVEFRPEPTKAQPLSWHLTSQQIADQQKAWPEDLCGSGGIQTAWQEMMTYLSQDPAYQDDGPDKCRALRNRHQG